MSITYSIFQAHIMWYMYSFFIFQEMEVQDNQTNFFQNYKGFLEIHVLIKLRTIFFEQTSVIITELHVQIVAHIFMTSVQYRMTRTKPPKL